MLNWRAKSMGMFLLGLVRLLTGAQARWYGCPPKAEQRIYFANHQSHADLVLIWAALPRSCAASRARSPRKDYWTASRFKRWITTEVFNAVYVERERKGDEDPLQPLIEALDSGDSLIMFPEGTRGHDEEPAALQVGPVQPGAAVSRHVVLVPAWITQRAAGHAQGRGGAGAGAVFGHLRRAHAAGRWRVARRLSDPRARRRDGAARGLMTSFLHNLSSRTAGQPAVRAGVWPADAGHGGRHSGLAPGEPRQRHRAERARETAGRLANPAAHLLADGAGVLGGLGGGRRCGAPSCLVSCRSSSCVSSSACRPRAAATTEAWCWRFLSCCRCSTRWSGRGSSTCSPSSCRSTCFSPSRRSARWPTTRSVFWSATPSCSGASWCASMA